MTGRSAATASTFPAPTRPEPDRRWALRAAGLLAIVAAALSTLLALATLMAGLGELGGVASQSVPRPPLRSVLSGALLDLIAAVGLGWIGLGCWRFRRWAPAAAGVAGWIWLLTGAGLLWLAPPFLRAMLREGPVPIDDPTVIDLSVWIAAGIIGVAGVAAPALLLLLVQGRRVQRTCERFDTGGPTTAIPPARLKLALSVAIAAVLLLPLAFGPAVPVFHWMVAGVAAPLLSLAVGGLLFWVAWEIWRGRKRGWWATLTVIVLVGASGLVSLRRIPLPDLLAGLGYDELGAAAFSGLDVTALQAAAVALTLGGVIYLLSVRRTFPT